MLDKIEGKDKGMQRWEALRQYRQMKQAKSSAANENAPKNKSSKGNEKPETTVNSQGKSKDAEEMERTRKRLGMAECETCKNRQYVDQSNDGSVSFQTPTHISPESAGKMVLSHEGEHVSNEQSKAKEKGAKVVSQNVRIFTSICPECGKLYVSGGLTTTVTAEETNKAADENDPQSRFDVHI